MIYRVVSVFFCVVVVITTICSAAPIDDLDPSTTVPSSASAVNLPELEAATLAYKKGKLQDCIDLLNSARERAAESGAGELPPTDLMLARLYMNDGQVAKGRALLEKVAVDHPGHPELYLLFGNLALSERRLTDAMLHFERALSGSIPDKWSPEQLTNLRRESHGGQARVSELREDWFRAQAALKEWSLDDPGNANVRDRLGAALFMLGREKEAYEQFQTAARQDSKMNPAEVSMAVMYARQRDFSTARQIFDASLKKYPSDGRVAYEYAAMLLLDNDAETAKVYADKAAEQGIETTDSLMQRGYIARQLKQFAAAETHFSRVLDKAPSHFEAMNQLALVLVEQDDKTKQQRALQMAEMNVRRFPESSFALSTLGWVLYRLGNKQRAEQALRLAANKPSMRTETLYYLMRVLWENGHKDDAEIIADRAREAFDQPGLFVLRDEAKKWMIDEFVN